jgi:hypothetical protein
VTLGSVDVPIGIHSLDVGRAVYVWVGTGVPRLSELVAAVPKAGSGGGAGGGAGAPAAASSLLSSGVCDRDEAEAFGRLLAARTGKMVYLAWCVPGGPGAGGGGGGAGGAGGGGGAAAGDGAPGPAAGVDIPIEARVELQRAVLAHLGVSVAGEARAVGS